MPAAKTTVSIDGPKFLINGRPTYEGRDHVEGLLFNVRTVHATFDDTPGKVDRWDDGSLSGNDHAGYGKWTSPDSASANTRRYMQTLAEYRTHGILAVNLNSQGGHPLNGKPWMVQGHGSAGARPNGHRDFYHNSGFNADGSIDEAYKTRISAAIEACDRLGMVVILQLFYSGQDTVFEDEGQLCSAVDCAVDFICTGGYRNVIVEIANEVMEGHCHHDILKPGRVGELIQRARGRARSWYKRSLLVTSSEAALLGSRQWTPEQIDAVFEACDLIVIHGGDNIETGKVGDASDLVQKVEYLRSRPWLENTPRPIITSEANGQRAFDALLRQGVSFGLHSTCFQTMYPPRWGIWDNETTWFFERVKALTGCD
ncbi:MAG: hypothetical protein MUQ30_08590 [Anaerolineae bacterium]|nr:hypothetical protein [Anaerolineae bacterium]